MVSAIGRKLLVSASDVSSHRITDDAVDMDEHEICRLSTELEQLDAEREALFDSCPPPVPDNVNQTTHFFKKLNLITARYLAIEKQLRQARQNGA
ncbi:hypothetical protein QA648_35365 (plasmid) [Rhizobium sp. CB3171]|uniref:hypothetical protein n=1 Tax=Rhizobium sp. CB3171 TaxID=3039157 RepID=UPI0024B154FC|nr:hypothetical protein [Rhizobium sp. CB3171]WFU07184.1 hypothetical protein QA648_35365 [Rhizobium sp. CB3171]